MTVPMEKISPAQQRRIDELRGFLTTVEHAKRLVAELDSNRAAKAAIINRLSSTIEREMAQLRQRALSANVGTLADTAGTLSIVAGREGGGLAMKIRALNDGVNGLLMQINQSLKAALHPDAKDGASGPS
jgi:ribosomal protein S9